MNKRKYKTNPKELLAMGRAIAKQGGHDAKFQHRVETVNLVLSGHSAAELSKNMGCHANTIIRWVKIDFALQEDPSKYGYNVWDGPSLSDFILRTYGIQYAVRSCQHLARQLGFSHVRP